jgi:ABC-2 type transport system permease protein
MTTFFRTLAAELLKLRRTLAFWLMFAAPLVIVALAFFMFYTRSAYYMKQPLPLWTSMERTAYVLWSVLMLPLYITLQTALLAGLEHGEDRWRNLLAMPVSRWSLYFAKLAIPCVMTLVSSLVLTFGCVADGLILRRLQPALRFPDPAPWDRAWHFAAITFVAALLVLTIQHWVSLRFSSFAASAGFGVAATVTGAIVINSATYGPWWPWCLPAQLVSTDPAALAHALRYSAIGAAIFTAAGAVEFRHREIR